jgi:hypothetical protein
MSDDPKTRGQGEIEKKGTNKEQTERIDAIVGEEVLGYEGSAQGEHSGQTAGVDRHPDGDLEDRLADNRPDQVK